MVGKMLKGWYRVVPFHAGLVGLLISFKQKRDTEWQRDGVQGMRWRRVPV